MNYNDLEIVDPPGGTLMPSVDLTNERLIGIGGSDVPAICGLDKYRSAFDIYCHKRRLLPSDGKLIMSDPMYWGHRMEPLILDEFMKRTNQAVIPSPFCKSKKWPFMVGHLDGMIIRDFMSEKNRAVGVLECKNVGLRNSLNWGDAQSADIPPGALLQTQHYLMVTGLEWAQIACLIDGNDFRIYQVPGIPSMQESLLKIETEFWERVENQDPPDPQGTDSDFKILQRMYPKEDAGIRITLPFDQPSLEPLAKAFFEARDNLSRVEADYDSLKAKIQAEMGAAAELILPDVGKITWKKTKDSTRTNYELACEKAEVAPDIIRECIYTVEGSRRFAIYDIKPKERKNGRE